MATNKLQTSTGHYTAGDLLDRPAVKLIRVTSVTDCPSTDIYPTLGLAMVMLFEQVLGHPDKYVHCNCPCTPICCKVGFNLRDELPDRVVSVASSTITTHLGTGRGCHLALRPMTRDFDVITLNYTALQSASVVRNTKHFKHVRSRQTPAHRYIQCSNRCIGKCTS